MPCLPIPLPPQPGPWLPEIDAAWLRQHRSHGVTHLLQRWRAIARSARLQLTLLHETAGYPVYFLTSRRVSARPLYFSAGVHGDETGAVMGLLEWAERSTAWLRQADVILVLRAGQLIEAGSHAELTARRGVYARLVERQMASVSDRS